MARRIEIEIDDTGSKRLQKKPGKEIKRILRLIGDQVSHGDTTRPVVDSAGVTVGSWRLTDG